MEQNLFVSIIADQTQRVLWEMQNVIDCVPDTCWNKEYCDMPVWKHIYHALHSLDLWFINPGDSNFTEPLIHEKDLNNLDIVTQKQLSRDEINTYFNQVRKKIVHYISVELDDNDLLLKPENCQYTRFTLILAQHRHLHTHMGMIMGFIINDTGIWPHIIGLEGEIPGAAEILKEH
ncbi:hypothetical protein [Kineothrix sp. MB12-C1]|uniref:hypothetical protein n=1 Tax=Kineothrix sp. MB12-C1 TaxID=3070215 RepID=UPI0027D27AC0|nr:hypothetical protein [Kineothrix sp. MB12-C1]WMC92547.1 hypothetical protein RBB56_17200 [Kineothrix sp. MB12-C1]